MRDTYQEQLSALGDTLADMCWQVAVAMEHATRALLEADLQLAEQVIAEDLRIDDLRASAEEKAFGLLALQAPVATDLRVVIAGIHSAGDIERDALLGPILAPQPHRRLIFDLRPIDFHHAVGIRVNMHLLALQYSPGSIGDFELHVAIGRDAVEVFRLEREEIVDVRLEKRFQMPSGHRFGVFFDGFNLTNSNAAEAMDDVTGRRTTTLPSGERVEFAQFMRPTAILNPRVYRFGVKYDF